MKRHTSSQFNKEKLLFVCTAALLSCSFYYLLTSQPAKLEAGTMVTNLPEPAAVIPGKDATRIPDINLVLNTRDRKNPFQPVVPPIEIKPPIVTDGGGTKQPKQPGGTIKVPKGPDGSDGVTTPVPSPTFTGETPKAQIDFCAAMTMNSQTFGLVRCQGRTLQVQVGNYIDTYRYTVTKIEKQAIWVTDELGRLFVARDLTFANLESIK